MYTFGEVFGGVKIRVFAVLLAATVAVAGVPTHPASAASGPVTVEGRGYGHGRGMSQWGARGMAEDSFRWQQIVRHYYTGISIAKRSESTSVRVLLDRDRKGVVVTSARPFSVRHGRGSFTTSRSSRYVRARMTSSGARVLEKSSEPRGPWTRIGRVNSALDFVPGASTLGMRRSGSEIRYYRGSLRVYRRDGGLLVVNTLRLDDYLKAVVPREMPALWPMEALKAQAVAARTYATEVRARARARDMLYDICGTTSCQVYGGVARKASASSRRETLEHSRSNQAVSATAGRIMVHDGRPIVAYYSSSSGGITAKGSQAYMKPVRDPYDRSPYRTWRTKLRPRAFEDAWPVIGTFRRIEVVSRVGSGKWGGRVSEVSVVGTKRTVRVEGGAFAYTLGLRSRWFSVVGQRERSTKTFYRPKPAPKDRKDDKTVTERKRYRFTKDMGYGSRGRDVRKLQKRLRAEGWFPVNVRATGYYGEITRDSVRRYQRHHGIRSTGYTGPITRRHLNRA